MLVESIQSLLDRFDIVIDSSGGLSSVEQTLGHGVIADFEIEDFGARTDLFLKLLTLIAITMEIVIDFTVKNQTCATSRG